LYPGINGVPSYGASAGGNNYLSRIEVLEVTPQTGVVNYPQKGVKPSPTCQFSRKFEGFDVSPGAKSL
jgi:hypothetical protein